MKLIEKLLNEVYGSKSELARELNIGPSTLTNNFKRDTFTPKTKKEITKAYNKVFETSYTVKELFES